MPLKADFSFDFRNVPESYWQTAERPMTVSDNFQTYGASSDWAADVRGLYGKVIPGQSGDPQIEGYPIGLTIEFNAYSFKVPSVSGGYIYEAHVINDSEKVYGVPLDYDSLWFGYNPGPSWWTRNSAHVIPEMGAVIWGNNGFPTTLTGGPACTAARPIPNPQGLTNTSLTDGCRSAALGGGFVTGGAAMMVLRSPLGDLRNKHFSNPDSPFYAPDHPLAGDTITFNRYAGCKVEFCMQEMMTQWGVRSLYGMVASDPLQVLAGRSPQALTPRQRYELFQGNLYNEMDEEVFCDPSNPRGPGCMSYVVPGTDNYIDRVKRQPTPTWTYTNRPPGAPVGPDTLFLVGCRMPIHLDHPHRNRCPGLFTDTVADRTRNFLWFSSFGPIAGPFPLKAGDTVPWVVATFAAPLAAQMAVAGPNGPVPGPAIYDWYNFYVNDFYLGPSQPPPPSIISVNVSPGSSQFGDTQVTLFLDNAAESWRDEYTLKFIRDLRNPVPGTFPAQVAAADPTAATRLEALIDRNLVDTVYIFKSCDLGRSVTADNALRCEPSLARSPSGSVLGTGWQYYAVLLPGAASQRFAKYFVDNNVGGGRRYLYALQAVSRGVTLDTRYLNAQGQVRDTVIEIIRPGRTPLAFQVSLPWVTEVYVPLMRQAGAQPAQLKLTHEQGPLRWNSLAQQISVTFFDNLNRSGKYRLLFGEDATVYEYSRAGASALDSTVVVVQRRAQAVLPSGSLFVGNLPERRYVNRKPHGVALGGHPDNMVVTKSALPGGNQVTTTHMGRKSGLLFDATTEDLLFVSGRIESGAGGAAVTFAFTPPDFTGHPEFRNFNISVDDRNNALSTAGAWLYQGAALRGLAAPSVVGQTVTSGQVRNGSWIFEYGAPIFGRFEELPLFEIANPQRTADAYIAMLERRRVVSRTEVSEAAARAIARLTGFESTTVSDLIEVKLPFTVTRVDVPGEAPGPVRVAMLRQHKLPRALLGLAPDSVSAAVPADVWIPGERLFLLEEVDVPQANADSTIQVNAAGDPIFTKQLRVTITNLTLGCPAGAISRITCNPIRGPGRASEPGYVEVRPVGDPQFSEGWRHRITFRNPITSYSVFEFEITPPRVGSDITKITQSMLDNVYVVPNPYLVVSAFDYVADLRRLMFTGLPPSGSIHIFTASGQYVQRLDWDPQLLRGTGDLAWDMNTKEGTEISGGLYVYVLETIDPESGTRLSKTDKFIVIK